MTPANELIAPLFRELKGDIGYWSIVDSCKPSLRPLLHVSGTSKIVAGMLRLKSGGLLILLPHVYFDDPDVGGDELDEGEGAEGEDGGGASSDAESPLEKQVGRVLLDWIETLTASPEAEAPGWIDGYRFESEVERSVRLERLDVQIAELSMAADELRVEQAQDARWKTLLYGSGAALERQVAAALVELGFEVEDVEPGRTDLRATRGDASAVVEVKGVGKSAAERHAAQLEKWVAEEMAAGRGQAKGILVVSGWRATPLGERSEPTFPAQMIPYSEQRGHCLVTGLQLLLMARACMKDPGAADRIAEMLINTNGTIEGWDRLEDVFREQPAEVVSSGDGGGDAAEQISEAAVESVRPEAAGPSGGAG